MQFGSGSPRFDCFEGEVQKVGERCGCQDSDAWLCTRKVKGFGHGYHHHFNNFYDAALVKRPNSWADSHCSRRVTPWSIGSRILKGANFENSEIIADSPISIASSITNAAAAGGQTTTLGRRRTHHITEIPDVRLTRL